MGITQVWPLGSLEARQGEQSTPALPLPHWGVAVPQEGQHRHNSLELFSFSLHCLHSHCRKCSEDTANKQQLFSCHFPTRPPVSGIKALGVPPHPLLVPLAFQALGNPSPKHFGEKSPISPPFPDCSSPVNGPIAISVQHKSHFSSVRSSLGSVGSCAVIPLLLGAFGALAIICLYSGEQMLSICCRCASSTEQKSPSASEISTGRGGNTLKMPLWLFPDDSGDILD